MHQVIISHGLGNQLFQYSFAHFLQSYTGKLVKIENSPIISNLGHGRSAAFKLNDFLANCTELQFSKHNVISNHSLFGRAMHRFGIAPRLAKYITKSKDYEIFIEERESTSFKFLPFTLDKTTPKTSFRGFFQNWRYVQANAEKIFAELSEYLELYVQKRSNFYKTLNSNLLVIHIRRGDFLARNRSSSEGILDLDSYRKIIKDICKNRELMQVVTVTDSPQVLRREGIDKEFGRIIGPDEESVWGTLKIMKEADFLIAGNSTLSWWGSFLVINSGGQAYIPEPFYRDIETGGAFNYPGFQTYDAKFLTF